MTGIGWIYAIFLLLKRLLLSATLEFTEGAINASMSLTLQSLDSALLLLLRPYSDAQATASEALAGLGDLSAYLAISLPVLFGPSVYIGDLPTLILAIWGVLVKLCTSVMESVAGALSTVFLLAHALQAAFPGVIGEALTAGRSGRPLRFQPRRRGSRSRLPRRPSGAPGRAGWSCAPWGSAE